MNMNLITPRDIKNTQQHQKYLVFFVLLNIPFFAITAFLFAQPLVTPVILQVLLGITCVIGWRFFGEKASGLDIIAICVAATPAVLVYQLSGHDWQIDAHMYFFAIMAMLIGLQSIRATILATLFIATHHLSLNFLLPSALFYGAESDFYRVIFHAVIVIIEASFICVTIYNFNKAEELMSQEKTLAQDALAQAEEAKERQELAEKRHALEKRKSIEEMTKTFDRKIGSLISSLGVASTDLEGTAEGMRSIASKTSDNSKTVELSTAEASQNVNTVASAMEEMSASSNEIAAQMAAVKLKSGDTAASASIANDTVNNLDQLVGNIGEVVTAIRDIAEQTNLLALNATIEAARAGDAGKGFAVVADEVKKLASETAIKTEEINARVTEIQNATKASVDAMDTIINNVSEIDTSVTGVSAAVEEQNATTAEIVRSLSNASQGVERVLEVINIVRQSADESGNSSDTVLSAARQVSSLSDGLKSSVDDFLCIIKEDKSAT